MVWEYRLEDERYSIEAGQLKGRSLPQWFLDEPPVFKGDEFYFQAFNDLNTCRQVGMEVGPIPWHRITEYGREAGLDDSIRKAFVRIIRAMDDAYRAFKSGQSTNTVEIKSKPEA